MADSGPDWGLIGAAAATIATAAGAVIAGMRGAFRERRSDRQKDADRARDVFTQRDKESVDHAALTLDGVFRLVNELQEEVGRKAQHIVDAEQRCAVRVQALEQRIGELERLVRELKQGSNP